MEGKTGQGQQSIPVVGVVVAVAARGESVVDNIFVTGGSSRSPAEEEKSKSKVSRNESPGWRITLACNDELMSEQADGLAHRGGFF